MIIEYQPTAEDPDYEWLKVSFKCPSCPTIVRFGISDLTDLPKIKPVKDRDGWRAQRTCPTCGPMRMFREVLKRGPESHGWTSGCQPTADLGPLSSTHTSRCPSEPLDDFDPDDYPLA